MNTAKHRLQDTTIPKLLLCISLVGLPISAMADQPIDRLPPLAQASAKPESKSDAATRVTAEQPVAKDSLAVDSKLALVEGKAASEVVEAELLEFVESQQPRLLKLLEFMKRKQPAQYNQALKELSKTKQRLANLEKRDPELYKIELQLWQVRSQLRMLIAEIAVSKDDAKEKLTGKLEGLVAQEFDLDTARLTLEQSRARQRLELLESQVRERTEDRDGTIAKSLKSWENRVVRQSPRKNVKPTK